MLSSGAWLKPLSNRTKNLEEKYVRTTRFATVSQATGQVTLPPLSEVVLDDFGGTVDAVVSGLDGGRPTMLAAYSSAGGVVSTSFDASGNYVLSAAPSAYPVAVVYRVRQKLKDFDSTASDIIGMVSLDAVPSSGSFEDSATIEWSPGTAPGSDKADVKDDSIAPVHMSAMNAYYDEQVPSFDQATGKFKWVARGTPGLVSQELPCDASVAVGKWVRVSSGVIVNAIASAETTANVFGVCEIKTSPTTCLVNMQGVTGDIFDALSQDTVFYLSDTVAGEMTDVAPVDPGHVVVPLGFAFNSDRFFVSIGTKLVRS